MIRIILPIALALVGGAPAAMAQEDCPAEAVYRGPPLRASLEEAAFPGSPGDTRPLAADKAAALDDLITAFRQNLKPPALGVAVITAEGETWSRASSPDRFYWASVGKAWTAIVVLQLVEEGRLSLTDTLHRWAPDFPNASLVTVEHLLAHTSGLYSFQQAPELRAEPGYKPPERVVAAARTHRPLFCPGEGWSYSNTGYALLGLIIEQVEGRSLKESLEARIVTRLGLKETQILGPGAPLVGIVPTSPVGDPGGTADDIRTPGAAGPVAATAGDMARFWLAAMSGKLLKAQTVRTQFTRLFPGHDPGTFYGLGVMVYDLPQTPNTHQDTWLGHSGGLPGARAVVAWSTRHRAVVAVALTGDGPAEALANRILASL